MKYIIRLSRRDKDMNLKELVLTAESDGEFMSEEELFQMEYHINKSGPIRAHVSVSEEL